MNKSLLLVLLMTLCSLGLRAQSSMTDLQVMQFVLKEHKAGTSQAQIVTKLMQRGVDIQQIRRVKDAYERVAKNKGLGQVSNGTNKDDKLEDSRMRKNNGENKTDTKNSQMIRSVGQDDHDYPTTHRNAADHGLITHELNEFLPDSATQQERDRLNIYVGRMPKRVFGRDIFNRKDLSFEPNMNIATPQNYRLGPGDAVNIDIYGASQKSEQTTVSPDGDVVIEGFGPVQVSGLTVAEANARLRSTLGSRYSSSRVRLTVGQTRTIMVNVMGEVKRPGTYTLSAFASVFHALYMAGGINDLGTLRNIKVYRQNKLVTVVDIYDYILNGKLTGNVRLADNDVVVVGAYDCLVNLTGKVKRPMYYEMKRSESVGTLLKYAGGFAGDAYTKAVRVVRKTGREYSVFNVDEFDFNTFHLADEDSVSVDSILPRFSNMVEVKGAVFRPGMYQVGGSINSVRTLIEHAEGITEEAFTARAVMHRMRPDRTLEVIPVDVEGIMSGKVADIPLQKNDVLFVPTKGEMMQQQTVTIHGEVMYPGIYKFAANETLEDLVLQAGGLKESASTTKVDVARRIINPKALSTDSVISRTYTFALKDGFVIDGETGFTLQPFDEVYVRKSPGYNVQKNIAVQGQVMFAGTYTLTSKNERLSDAIKRAGGVTDLAYIRGARLERRITPDERLRMETVLRLAEMQSGKKDSVEKKRLDLGDTYYVGIELEKALAEPGGDADLVLREGDKLIVPEYNGTVKISGNVMYPNTVAYEKGRRPAWYINQAGGFGNRAKKSNTYIIYMNGTVARVGHNAKVRPGCEIVVPTKPEGNGKALTQWLSVGTTVAGLATLIAAIANLIK
ncbi:polysaccharide biosynthesis/export family protein [Hoylesella loescheii]|uniref:Polysaccharide biosynthesis/export protein n=1 Tax=Hoylesella loescheii DSM 19665 = JCM 12249 = ATCC 15930 TaxID=1122985 RepID=A0A069QJN9_HOYLO|nr:SLBB domain-containing protein [Hoylesella loescheii]KDR53058.1 polysaccharide biosynthesis/export protein [Hoylesella loescheii DSM 19665 = JCM 12249 = ATCC 15930]